VLTQVLDECGVDRIVDIGSGSGGPMQLVLKEMAKLGHLPHVTLTDLYPAPAGSSLDYWPEPVCASNVPPELRGVRTLFTCFHHFNPPVARAVLGNAFAQRQPICIFEATSRTTLAIAASFAIPFLVLFLTPRVRPLSASQIALTYLIPIMPLLALWDGFVSQLRTYSIAELQALTRDCSAPDYVWKCGLIKLRVRECPSALVICSVSRVKDDFEAEPSAHPFAWFSFLINLNNRALAGHVR